MREYPVSWRRTVDNPIEIPLFVSKNYHLPPGPVSLDIKERMPGHQKTGSHRMAEEG